MHASLGSALVEGRAKVKPDEGTPGVVDERLEDLFRGLSLRNDVLQALDLRLLRVEAVVAAAAHAAHLFGLELVVVVRAAVFRVLVVPLASKAVVVPRVLLSVLAFASAGSATAADAAKLSRDELPVVGIAARGWEFFVEVAGIAKVISQAVFGVVAVNVVETVL